MTKQKLIDAEEEKRRLEEESAQVRELRPPVAFCVLQMMVGVWLEASCWHWRSWDSWLQFPRAFFIYCVKCNGSD